MTRTILVYSIYAFILFVSLSASSVVMRHDVEPKKYDATWHDFPALAQFYVDGAHGSLIAPTWVVTAAHTTFCTDPGSTILVGGEKAIVKRRFVHPEHTPGVSHDLAMLELTTSVTHVSPARLYLEDQEVGKIITFIGAGGSGTGIDGQTIPHYENKGFLRKANNRVDQAKGPLLEFVFHRGNDALPLEGIGGEGDSGGPAFMREGDEFIVLGVSSRGEFGSTAGKYGNREFYTRLSFFKDWINDVMYGSEEKRAMISIPKLKHLLPSLTKDNLPQICKEIGIAPR